MSEEEEPNWMRLEGIRRLAQMLRSHSKDDSVWSVTVAIEQLCMGTITVDQALAQVGEPV